MEQHELNKLVKSIEAHIAQYLPAPSPTERLTVAELSALRSIVDGIGEFERACNLLVTARDTEFVKPYTTEEIRQWIEFHPDYKPEEFGTPSDGECRCFEEGGFSWDHLGACPACTSFKKGG
jgi:hypothetical protein